MSGQRSTKLQLPKRCMSRSEWSLVRCRVHGLNPPCHSYLSVYCYAVVAVMGCSAFCVWFYVGGSMRASRIVHEKLVASVLGTTLR